MRAPRCVRCGGQSLAHALARGSADHIVAVERGLSVTAAKKSSLELLAELAQFVEREERPAQRLFDGEAHGVADLLVRGAEGNALVDEISGRGHGIQVAGLRGFVHALAIELRAAVKRATSEASAAQTSTAKAGSWVSCMSLL
jgi:hypothetical protein